MINDLREEYVTDCFDLFFVAAEAGNFNGGLLGYDSWEQDYFGISCSDSFAEDEAKKKLKQMTKDELIVSARQYLKVYHAYMGLRNRYDSLKSAIDILREQNTIILQVVKQIEILYENASKKQGGTDFISRGFQSSYVVVPPKTFVMSPDDEIKREIIIEEGGWIEYERKGHRPS